MSEIDTITDDGIEELHKENDILRRRIEHSNAMRAEDALIIRELRLRVAELKGKDSHEENEAET
jgi:hypothetical protein